MPTSADPANPTAPPQPALTPPDADEVRRHDEWFTTTPDPWKEIVRLEFGADRTFATTVNGMIANAEPKLWPGLETKLMAALNRPELTAAGRLFVCRMLGLIGSAACVPAVAKLLGDEQTADVGRMVLDPISSPSVDVAYRTALEELHGRALIGLIGSIVARGDMSATVGLAKIAADEKRDPTERKAAAHALTRLEKGEKA